MPDYKKAKEKAQKLIEQYNINEPVVPVFEIAEKEGIKLKIVKMSKEHEDIAGFLDSEESTIYINTDDSPNRQIFTVAHELGHSILEHKSDKYDILLRRPVAILEKNPLEQEANCFAANLLVPYKMLKNIMKKYSLTEEDIKPIAKIFGVSEDVIKFRFKSMKYDC